MTAGKKSTELPRSRRPDVKILEGSLRTLSDVDLLATCLGSGVKNASAKEIARKILRDYGRQLLTLDAQKLLAVQGIGRKKAAKLVAALQLACRLLVRLAEDELQILEERVRETGQQLTLVDILRSSGALVPEEHDFTFIDLFAGIGGIRKAFEQANGRSVFSCEWDRFAKLTYERNFGEIPFGDIKNITSLPDEDLAILVPDHDVLCAGFPCQPFSLAGVSKKNALGRKHGFDDLTQGTLFFDIKRILEVKRPAAFFLENVKNILHHDGGRTWAIIEKTLVEELGYVFRKEVVDAAQWVPQHRERVFMVGYNPDKVDVTREGICIPRSPEQGYRYPELGRIVGSSADPKYTLGPGTWNTLERHRLNHAAKGNGFGYGLIKMPIAPGTVTRTISARYHKDGAEILIETSGPRPRKLTVEEAMQLQGFDPKDFSFDAVSDTQAYRQIGNSVAIPAVAATAREMATVLRKKMRSTEASYESA